MSLRSFFGAGEMRFHVIFENGEVGRVKVKYEGDVSTYNERDMIAYIEHKSARKVKSIQRLSLRETY